MGAVQLADMKAYLRITNDDEDAALGMFLETAETMIVNYVGPLVPTTKTTRVNGCSGVLSIPAAAVISITSVTPNIHGGAAVHATDLDVDTMGTVTTFSGVGFPWSTYTVVYVAGYEPIPAPLLMAVKELVRHLWQTQRGPTGRPGALDPTPVPGASYSMPNRVLELLSPYMLPGVA